MTADDRAYYRRRAQTETEIALGATTSVVVKVHHQLAAEYRRKLASAEPVLAAALRPLVDSLG